MYKKNICFIFKSYTQAEEIINFCKKNNVIPIIFIKYYLINGLGISWFIELKKLLISNLKKNNFKTYVEVKDNYGLMISLIENKTDYIKVRADNSTLKRLQQIAKLNNVLINPSFSILELNKSKNLNVKLKKLFINNLLLTEDKNES